MPLLALDSAALARLIADHGIDLVVNCIGLLQDGPGGDVAAVHRDFVARLLRAIRDCGRAIRLVHISIPGAATEAARAGTKGKPAASGCCTSCAVSRASRRRGSGPTSPATC